MFFQFFNRCGGIEKSKQNLVPQEKVEMTLLHPYLPKRYNVTLTGAPTYNYNI